MKSLQERVKELTKKLSIMEGKTKGENCELEDKIVTINDFDIIKGDNDYAVYTVKEIEDTFFFGGMVLTEQLKQLEAEGYKEAIQKEGLRVRLKECKSKKGRSYYSVEFEPKEV